MSNCGIEKALAAGLEPLIEAISDLEKKVAELQVAVEKLAHQPEQSSASTAEILRVGKR